MSARGDVAVVFGSQIRARLNGGSWTAFLDDSIAQNVDDSGSIGLRPWLSPDGGRFMASWRYGSGFHAPTSVRALTVEATDWAHPRGEWPKPGDVAEGGFKARHTVPAPPLLMPSDYYLSDMMMASDGVSTALLLSPTVDSSRVSPSLLWWNGRTWTPLALPIEIGRVQWPGYAEACGQNYCNETWAKSELSLDVRGPALLAAVSLPPAAPLELGFEKFDGGGWDPHPAPMIDTVLSTPKTWGFELAQESGRALAGWSNGCSVWNGDAWVAQARQRNLSSIVKSTWQSLGISGDGSLAICAGETFAAGANKVTAAVWTAAGWQTAVIGTENCEARDVAVSSSGQLAAISLVCPSGPEVATYANGTWTVERLASEGRGGPLVAVSADGSSAVAVWLETGGLFAALFHQKVVR